MVGALGFSPLGDKGRRGDKPSDRARAAMFRGDIMIHGQPNDVPDMTQLRGDWTAGSNAAIRDIYFAADLGRVVKIRPW